MIKREWRSAIQVSDWRQPKDDVAILVAQVFIILRNPSLIKRGKAIPDNARRGFYQQITVPANAPDEQKEAAIKRGTAWLIDAFDRLYAQQDVFEITDETIAEKPKGKPIAE